MVGKSGASVMSDKDKPKDVMRSPYIDGGSGKKIRIAVSYSQLSESLKARLGPDLTERDLLKMLIKWRRLGNILLMKIANEEITEKDIECLKIN